MRGPACLPTAPLLTGIDPSVGLTMSKDTCASRANASTFVVGERLSPPYVHDARPFSGPSKLCVPRTVIDTAVPAAARDIACEAAVAAESLIVSGLAAGLRSLPHASVTSARCASTSEERAILTAPACAPESSGSRRDPW